MQPGARLATLEELTMDAWPEFTKERAQKLKVPQLRAGCEKRKFSNAGYKADLVARLSSWKSPLSCLWQPLLTPPSRRALVRSVRCVAKKCFGLAPRLQHQPLLQRMQTAGSISST